MFEKAKVEALHGSDVYEKLRVTQDLEIAECSSSGSVRSEQPSYLR